MEKHEFQPKEWVLVRDDDDEEWTLNIFSHKSKDYFYCVSSMWEQCLPYEGNEALLGTTDAPKEKEDWKVGDKVEVLCKNDDKWYPGKIIDIDSSRIMQFKVESSAFKEWRGCPLWCAAGQLRKPEEKPNEEFKFGDKVEIRKDDEWCEAVVIENDHSDIPYKVATADGDIHWRRKGDVRHA